MMKPFKHGETFNPEGLRNSLQLALREYTEALLLAILLAVIVRIFVMGVYRIPTDKMMPTLLTGDFIVTYKIPYGFRLPIGEKRKVGMGTPKRGSVVVFRCPYNPRVNCVKRVVGLPGDRVQISGKRIILNGSVLSYKRAETQVFPGEVVALEENDRGTARAIMIGNDRTTESFGPVVIPAGNVFVLSDFRDNTEDSRRWGPIPIADIEGRALLVWMSLDWSQAKPKVRWRRLLTRVR